ncbi:hypothetical protein [Bacillus subtilis]|uniref:hypothetical protein n=1 Tax=Bacillus subtilis TaxID=1423 RepID=UPI0027957A83|nr:hypothetical protein [Bacillus subtilis]
MSVKAQATIQAVERALLTIKTSSIDINDEYYKNKIFLEKLGWQPSHILNEIKKLSVRDYCEGPQPNLSKVGPKIGAIWIFGKKIKSMKVYIKFHIIPIGGSNSHCVCMSFHEEEEGKKPLTFPYANT